MRKIYFSVMATSATLFCVFSASASTINIGKVSGSVWTVSNVADWETTGNLMDNISITVSGKDANGVAFSNTVSWADNIGASGAGWSLTMNDYNKNTWDIDSLWNFSANTGFTIENLTIDGKPGDTVFDIIFDPDTTPGSESGQEIWEPGYINPNLTVNAEYSNLVMVAGSNGPLGDLYQTLNLNFGAGLAGGQKFVFSLDTDNVNAPVPEPATMLMLGTGLVGLAGMRLKRRKK